MSPPTLQDSSSNQGLPAGFRHLRWRWYLLAPLLTLATLIARLALGFTIGEPPILILFTLPIMLSAYLGGLGPGLAATVLGVLLANYVLLPPQYTFSISTKSDLLQTGGVLIAGTLISVLSEQLRRARQRAEASQQAQHLIAAIVESSNDAIIGTDLPGTVVSWNASAQRLFGYTADEIVGHSITLLIPPDRPHEEAKLLERIAHGERIDHFETVRQHKDGSLVEVAVTISPIRDGHGQIIGVSKAIRDISASKRSAAALAYSEARFATAFRASPAAMSITRINDGRFVDINASHERIFGYPRDELIGQTADTIGIYADPTQRNVVVQIIRDHGWLHNADLTLRTKTGDLRTVLCSLEPFEFDGEPCLLGTVVDITERTQVERALRASEARFRHVFVANPSPELITRIDTGQIVNANPAFTRMVGYTLEELLGQTTDALGMWPEHVPLKETRAQLRQAGQLANIDIPIRTRDGRIRELLLSIVQVEYDGMACFLKVMLDQTERKRTADRLQVLADASHAFAEVSADYQSVLDQVVQTIAGVLGEGCNVRLVSDDAILTLAALYDADPERRELQRMVLGAAPVRIDESALAARVFQSRQPLLLSVVDREQVRAATKPEYRSLIDSLDLRSLIFVPIQAYGQTMGVLTLYRSGLARPPFDSDDLILAQDLADRAALAITNARLFQQVQHELVERLQAEQALEAERALLAQRVAERTTDLSLANAELARAARLKDEFLANMSHELRTPLTAILGRSEAFEEQIYGPVSPKQVEVLHSITESGKHLLTLINDILDLSKIEAGKLKLECEPVFMDMLCMMSVRMVAQMAVLKRVTITSNLDGMVEIVHADERRLKQILVNLLSNAVKFTPEGGQVGLDMHGNIEQQTVTFTVWDTGIGIAESDLPKLFQPFVQIESSLSRHYEGTGLGLALVRRLAEAHGGNVAVTSAVGQGSHFSVILPWHPATHIGDSQPMPIPAASASALFQRALVIEDSATAADQISRYLVELGTTVDIYRQGIGALARAIAVQPDVILLDLLLPDQSGWEVLRQLKAEPKIQSIPVIVVSVVDDPARSIAQGAAALLVKPIDRTTLMQVLRKVAIPTPALRGQPGVVRAPQRPRILLAEDNQATVDMLCDYLQMKGYAVTVARNGHEALAALQAELPEIILMDIQMPNMDGLEAIRHIRVTPSMGTVPIIALTALAMAGDRERCLAAGANAYLTKPLNLRHLVDTIETQRQQDIGDSHRIPPTNLQS